MRAQTIERAHTPSLVGIQYTMNTAKEVMYWPQMQAELTEAVRPCDTMSGSTTRTAQGTADDVTTAS